VAFPPPHSAHCHLQWSFAGKECAPPSPPSPSLCHGLLSHRFLALRAPHDRSPTAKGSASRELPHRSLLVSWRDMNLLLPVIPIAAAPLYGPPLYLFACSTHQDLRAFPGPLPLAPQGHSGPPKISTDPFLISSTRRAPSVSPSFAPGFPHPSLWLWATARLRSHDSVPLGVFTRPIHTPGLSTVGGGGGAGKPDSCSRITLQPLSAHNPTEADPKDPTVSSSPTTPYFC